MGTMSLNQILVAVLLGVLIVLAIFLIVFVVNATKTVKKANMLLDDGLETVNNVKQKYNDIKGFIEKTKIVGIADTGLHFAKVAIKKAKDRRNTNTEIEE